MNKRKRPGFWVFVLIAVFLVLMMLLGQTGSLIDYDFTVSIGLQESVEEVTAVGVAWALGFAFGDTLVYIPLFIVGIAGLLKERVWGFYSMFGALAITAYWPIVSLFAVFAGRNTMNLNPEKYLSWSIVLPLIAIYGLWGMWFLYKNRNDYLKDQQTGSE